MRTVASDLTHGEVVAIGGGIGSSSRCAPASQCRRCSQPVLVDGRTLVDGGIANPVGAVQRRARPRRDVVIAVVEVIPRLASGRDDRVDAFVTRAKSHQPARVSQWSRRQSERDRHLMNAFHLVEFELSTYQARNADIVVRPELPCTHGSNLPGTRARRRRRRRGPSIAAAGAQRARRTRRRRAPSRLTARHTSAWR